MPRLRFPICSHALMTPHRDSNSVTTKSLQMHRCNAALVEDEHVEEKATTHCQSFPCNPIYHDMSSCLMCFSPFHSVSLQKHWHPRDELHASPRYSQSCGRRVSGQGLPSLVGAGWPHAEGKTLPRDQLLSQASHPCVDLVDKNKSKTQSEAAVEMRKIKRQSFCRWL